MRQFRLLLLLMKRGSPWFFLVILCVFPNKLWQNLVAQDANKLRSWEIDITGSQQTNDHLSFFEKKIRPVLIEHCYSCHSAQAQASKKLKGGLFLDTREGWARGGDSGPTIIPGKPGESLFLKSLHYDGDLRMPPKGKLPREVVADLERWIASGAIDPRTGGAQKPRQVGLSLEAGKQFWSYRPVAKVIPPLVKDAGWGKNELDRFVLNRLEASSLKPSPQADRATLLRRLSLDLLGLPPTPGELDAFQKDESPDAWEKRVDRMLARTEFGERWARHWLDLARYADSVTLRGFVFKSAWQYRDYVINSFNSDVPYGRFLQEQIAGDLLEAKDPREKARNLIATTYLMLGNTNLEEQDKKQLRMDFVDEQLDVIGKGILAQTWTCARCHDHKFDPVSTRDYYALAGILRNTRTMEHANVSAWTEVPLPLDPAQEKPIKENEERITRLESTIKALKTKGSGDKTVAGIVSLNQVGCAIVDDTQAKKVGQWQESTHSGSYVGSGYVHDQNGGKGEKTLSFVPNLPADGKYEVRLAYSSGNTRADKVPVTVFCAEGEKTIHVDMKKAPTIDGRFISLGTFAFEKAGQSFVLISNEGTKGHVTADCVLFLSPGTSWLKDKSPDAKTPEQGDLSRLEGELKALKTKGPRRPMAMAPQEEKTIEDCKVHIRGMVSSQGAIVPRGVPEVMAAGGPRTFPKNQSGRKELAQWIASKENPLTRRVMANRVWYWLMGSGIVRTVDNFGTTGEAPSHPKLLDYLAMELAQNNDSIKGLIRKIVTSQTYRLASSREKEPEFARLVQSDPENRLFGRANKKRLEAEALRDAVLVIAGNLDSGRNGPGYPEDLAADYGFESKSNRRSIYLPMFRNAMPEILEVFDAADTSMVTGKRNASTVAPQALFLLNHPWVRTEAEKAARRHLEQTAGQSTVAQVDLAYRLCLGRLPQPGERAIIDKYLSTKTEKVEAWTGVFHALFACADFRTID